MKSLRRVPIHFSKEERMKYILEVKNKKMPEIEAKYLRLSDRFYSVGSEMKKLTPVLEVQPDYPKYKGFRFSLFNWPEMKDILMYNKEKI